MKKLGLILFPALLLCCSSPANNAEEEDSNKEEEEETDVVRHKAKLANDVDTISYLCGYLDIKYNKPSIFSEEGMNVDSIYMNEFMKGLVAGIEEDMSGKKKAYQAGLQLGMERKKQLKGLASQIYGSEDTIHTLNTNEYLAGIMAALTEKGVRIKGDDQELTMKVNEIMSKIYEENLASQNEGYKEQNENYIATISKKAGVKSLGDGIYYEVITQGNGAIPTMEQSVKVHYEGKAIDGNIFDSSYERGEPIEVMPTQVIAGWTKALTSMPVGSKWIVYIPYEQGYGASGNGSIKGFSTLIFTIELLSIIK